MLTEKVPTTTDTSETVILGSKKTRISWRMEIMRIALVFDITGHYSTRFSNYTLLWKQTQTDFSVTLSQSRNICGALPAQHNKTTWPEMHGRTSCLSSAVAGYGYRKVARHSTRQSLACCVQRASSQQLEMLLPALPEFLSADHPSRPYFLSHEIPDHGRGSTV